VSILREVKEERIAAEENLWVEKVLIRDLKGIVALRAIEGEGPEGVVILRGVRTTSFLK
jgi:hypothetical protein